MRLHEHLTGIGSSVAYYPNLARAFGGVKAAILLSRLIQWEGYTRPDADRWIYKTREEIEHETGLTFEEQRGARLALEQTHQVVESRYARREGRLYFRVNIDRMNDLWEAFLAGKSGICEIHKSRVGDADHSGNSQIPNSENPTSGSGQTPNGDSLKPDFVKETIRLQSDQRDSSKTGGGAAAAAAVAARGEEKADDAAPPAEPPPLLAGRPEPGPKPLPPSVDFTAALSGGGRQQSAQDPAKPDPAVAGAMLRGLGVDDATAEELATRHPYAQVRAAVEKAKTQARGNPAGYVVQLLRSGAPILEHKPDVGPTTVGGFDAARYGAGVDKQRSDRKAAADKLAAERDRERAIIAGLGDVELAARATVALDAHPAQDFVGAWRAKDPRAFVPLAQLVVAAMSERERDAAAARGRQAAGA